jgi:hypothetical protein
MTERVKSSDLIDSVMMERVESIDSAMTERVESGDSIDSRIAE